MSKFPDLGQLRILHYPDPRLRDHAADVHKLGTFFKELRERMGELMNEAKGAGLAATQVGLPYRVVVLPPPEGIGAPVAYINPVIIAKEGKQFEEEGCLSVPGIWAKIRRAQKVRVRAETLDGEVVEMEGEGLIARAWQHEIDHLDGSLFVDRVGPAGRIIMAGKLRGLQKEFERQAAPEKPGASD